MLLGSYVAKHSSPSATRHHTVSIHGKGKPNQKETKAVSEINSTCAVPIAPIFAAPMALVMWS